MAPHRHGSHSVNGLGARAPSPRDARERLGAPAAAVLLALTSAAVGACGERPIDGWTVEGDAPPAFVDEIHGAAAMTFEVVGLKDRRSWRGTVHVEPRPFECLRSVTCHGTVSGPFDVRVVYDEENGLGPALGTTALEHELCHAALLRAGTDASDNDAADACAGEVVRRLREAGGP